jgi:hypothetical protein
MPRPVLVRDRAEQIREGSSLVGHTVPWTYNDPWAGHAITPGTARAELYYAKQMHDAAMSGRLDQFMEMSKHSH